MVNHQSTIIPLLFQEMPTLGLFAKDSFLDLVEIVEASGSAPRGRRFLALNRNDSNLSRRKKNIIKTLPSPADTAYIKRRENKPPVVRFWKEGSDWTSYEYTAVMESQSIHNDRKRNYSENCGLPFQPSWGFCPRVSSSVEEEEEDDDSWEEYDYLTSSMSEESETRAGGIMKEGCVVVPVFLGVERSEIKTFVPKTHQGHSTPSFRKIRFSPTIRIVPIRPLHAMKKEDKSNYWWQSRDFDHFKQEVCILANPKEDETNCSRVLLLDEQQQGSFQNSNREKRKDDANDEGSNTRCIKKALIEKEVIEKQWWHKYGDSRRGLEKIACSLEHDQIVISTDLAIRKVLWEQRCMKRYQQCWSFFLGNNRKRQDQDAERLARIYHEYTAWSRDLALAAAASDRDAVQTDFDDSKRKTREFFLLKQFFHHGKQVHKYMPQFMLPHKHGEIKALEPEGFLDDHTSNMLPVSV